jgi:hypothetical protein
MPRCFRVPITLQVTVANEIDLDGLVRAVGGCPTLTLAYQYQPGSDHILLTFTGDATVHEISHMAEQLVPKYWEFLDNYPTWQPGYLGVIQLLTLLYVHQYYLSNVK